MDYTMIYILGICLMIIGLGALVTYIKKKHNLKNEDMIEGINILETSATLIRITLKDMKFGKEDEIDKVTGIILKSLDYIKQLDSAIDKKDKITNATKFAINLCKELNIEMNKDRIYMLNTVITVAYNMVDSIEKNKNKAITE